VNLCIIPAGTSASTVARVRAAEATFWCDCASPSDVTYFNDHEHPACAKHHWRCADCSKVVQVG
jgi:hypothetical protein